MFRYINTTKLKHFLISKVDPALAHRVRALLFENFLRVYFWKILLHNMHKLYCNQHEMFTKSILFSSLTTKA